MWSYDFPDPEGPNLGIVAVPGSDAIQLCEDPVAVISDTLSLGMNVGASRLEVLVVIDRADRVFSPSEFYIFRTPANTLEIGSTEDVGDRYDILGRIALCILPFREEERKPPTGFLEEDED